jgi:hypothetical protein
MTIPVNLQNAADAARAVKAGELPGPAKSLAEALARIYADGGRYVQKTGQMQGTMRYSYAKEGDFIAAIRPLMETHGVTIRPKAVEAVLMEVIETSGDRGTRRQNRAVVRVTFELLHVSGDHADIQTFGEGIDSGDKAFNKAMTGAMKYAMRQTFCVETGDDPDDTPSSQQERAAAVSPPQSKPAPKAVPPKPQLVAKYAMKFGACPDRPAYLALCEEIAADPQCKELNDQDRGTLKEMAKAVTDRLPPAEKPAPKPQPAKA